MKKYPPIIRIGGPLLGLLLMIFLINAGVNRLQADQAALREEVRLAQFDVSEAPAETAAPEAVTPDVATPEVAATPEAAATPEVVATPEAVATPEVVVTPEVVATPEAAAPAPTAETAAADATSALSGEALKTAAIAAINKGTCAACHTITSVPGAVGMLGPNLDNIGAIAGTRVAGLSAQEYLLQSIIEPNAFIAPDCPLGACLSNVMLANLADILSPEEIDTIVAYLATLKSN